jgi:hypothetical protein
MTPLAGLGVIALAIVLIGATACEGGQWIWGILEGFGR